MRHAGQTRPVSADVCCLPAPGRRHARGTVNGAAGSPLTSSAGGPRSAAPEAAHRPARADRPAGPLRHVPDQPRPVQLSRTAASQPSRMPDWGWRPVAAPVAGYSSMPAASSQHRLFQLTDTSSRWRPSEAADDRRKHSANRRPVPDVHSSARCRQVCRGQPRGRPVKWLCDSPGDKLN